MPSIQYFFVSFWMFSILFAFFTVLILFVFANSIWNRKRQQELAELSRRLGLRFFPKRDYSMDERFPFLEKLCRGRNRYAYNILQGEYRGHPVCVFDYHFETRSRDSKGRSKTRHHYFSFFILLVNRNFPELIITQEGWFSKVAQWFGYSDIDFESAEFSRKFIVRSPDKKFAYDICHGQMIEYMLRNQDLSIEIERNCVTLFFGSVLATEQIPVELNRLIEVREMFPNYLMEG